MSAAQESVKPFRKSEDLLGFAIILTSVVPYLLLLYITLILQEYSFVWLFLLVLPTHWFHARMFIVMHDCGHHSLFKTRFFNDLFGHICAFFYYVPFYMWRELHNKHHQYQGNLQKRGLSLDVWTLTVNEYQKASVVKKITYGFYRHPLTILFVSPIVLFLVIFRLPFEKFSTKAIVNILALDAILISALYFNFASTLRFFSAQWPSLLLSYTMASFLFYVQHQFAQTLWLTDEKYSNELISLHGSSYLKLPTFFMWAYGNIAYHHVHHLDVKIPMYKLPQAHKALSVSVTGLSLAQAIASLRLKLWSPELNRLTASPKV